MSLFTYNRDIPDAPNNPSNDQPKMKTNTNSTDDLIAVDHVSFNDTPGGTHLQSTYSSKNTPAAQIDPQSVVYTTNGTASTRAELNFINQSGTYRLSSLKAFGVFTTVAGAGPALPVALDMGINVVSITKTNAIYTINLTPNAVQGTTVIVFLNNSNDNSLTWSYALDTLSITTSSPASAGIKISFVIMQM